MLLLPLIFATLASALPQSILKTLPDTEYTILDQTLSRQISSLQHILDASKPRYNILTPELLEEIDQLRRDWHIKGAGIAVVRLKDDGEWEQDTLGIGIADGAANAVTEHVGQKSLFGEMPLIFLADPLRYGLQLEIIHGHCGGAHRCQRNVGIHLEDQDQGRRARMEVDGSCCFRRNRSNRSAL